MSVTANKEDVVLSRCKERSTQVLLIRRLWNYLHYLVRVETLGLSRKTLVFFKTKSTRVRARTHITTSSLVISLWVSTCESVAPDRAILMCAKGIPSTIKQSTGSVHFTIFGDTTHSILCCKFVDNNAIHNNAIRNYPIRNNAISNTAIRNN